jgi:hypothetical protein
MNNAIYLDTTNTVLNQYPDVRNPSVLAFLFVRQASFRWFLLRLQDNHSRQVKPLKTRILRQDASFWQAIACLIRYALIVSFSFIRQAQEAYRPVPVNEQNIFDRVFLFLPAVIDFLLLAIFWSCYRSFCAIMAEKRGASGSISTASARNCSASSAAVRAGNNRWAARASFRISRSSRTHLLTFD